MYVEIPNLMIKMTVRARQKINSFIAICPEEISGFGIVERTRNIFLIKDVFILKQSNNPAHTEMDPDAIYEAVTEANACGEDTSAWGLWWHSHVNFAAQPSGQDLRTIELLASKTPLISLIQNKAGEMYLRLDVYEPVRVSITELPLTIEVSEHKGVWKQCLQEFKDKVTLVGHFFTGR